MTPLGLIYFTFTFVFIAIIYLAIREFKKITKRRFIQLKKEQEYPIVFTREDLSSKVKGRTRFSASMTENTFTNVRTGGKIDITNYIGFVIFGNTNELNIFHGNHGDLIFVKKHYRRKELLNEFVVVCKNQDYFIQRVRVIKKEYITLDGGEVIDVKSIIGPIEFDFNII